jgi:hypothetical protein
LSVKFQFVGGSDRLVVERLQAVSPALRKALATEMTRQTTRLRDLIVATKLSGQVLKNRTGTLRRSVMALPVEVTDDAITGTVGVSNKAWYGKLHEYGGVYPVAAATRVSRLGKVFTVRAHSITLPVRSFMRSTLYEEQSNIKRGLEAAMKKAVAAA